MLVVMASVPVASVGVVLVLIFSDTTLNLQSGIGCLMLAGIVFNNAILLVDQAGQLRRQGNATADAVIAAGERRLRPVMMTTLTTVLALLPLALGIGEGAETQAPLARVVVGGMLSSTAITLFLAPVVYILFHRDTARSRDNRTRLTSSVEGWQPIAVVPRVGLPLRSITRAPRLR